MSLVQMTNLRLKVKEKRILDGRNLMKFISRTLWAGNRIGGVQGGCFPLAKGVELKLHPRLHPFSIIVYCS